MSDLNLIKPQKVQNIINKFCLTIGMIPTSYKLSLSYEEQVLTIGKYLEDIVYPAINNNAEAVTELQDLFIDLKNYVDNYFTDLNVQSEINNKLDEMSESGQLTEIIGQYLRLVGIITFSTLLDVKNSSNLQNGNVIKTLGENNLNDGNGSFYKIREITSSDVVDEINIISLDNFENLIAERIFNNLSMDKSNPIYYGADPLGILDSSEAIQKCLDNNINKQIIFTPGTYLVNTPIDISYNNQYGGINFNNSTIINNTENDYIFGIGSKNHKLDVPNSSNNNNRFYNISNVKIKSKSRFAIIIDRWFMNVRFDNIDIFTTKNGIQIGKIYDGYGNKPADVELNNFIITNEDMTKDYVAINVIGTDNKFNNGRIYGFKTGINANNNLVILSNIHFLATNFGENNLDNNYICIKNSSSVMADLCYCDSYPCFIKPFPSTSNASIMITNLYVYSWHNQFTEASLFDFSEVTSASIDLNYKNIQLRISNYPLSTKIIENSSNLNTNISLNTGFNSHGNIRVNGINEMTNSSKDLALSNDKVFLNNYNSEWKQNWIKLGVLNIFNGGLVYIKIIDDSLGEIVFKVRLNTDLTINTAEKLTTTSQYAPALGFNQISSGVYEVYYAKNKNNLATTTNVLTAIHLIKNLACYIVPINQDLHKIGAPTSQSVDIIST